MARKTLSEDSGITVERGIQQDRETGFGLGKPKTRGRGCVPHTPLSAMPDATLFAFQRGSNLDTAQTLPVAAQDALDAIVPTGEPAGQLRDGQGEITLGQ